MKNENGGEPNLYASSDIIPVIDMDGLKPLRECTKTGSYMTTILDQKNPKIVNKESKL